MVLLAYPPEVNSESDSSPNIIPQLRNPEVGSSIGQPAINSSDRFSEQPDDGSAMGGAPNATPLSPPHAQSNSQREPWVRLHTFLPPVTMKTTPLKIHERNPGDIAKNKKTQTSYEEKRNRQGIKRQRDASSSASGGAEETEAGDQGEKNEEEVQVPAKKKAKRVRPSTTGQDTARLAHNLEALSAPLQFTSAQCAIPSDIRSIMATTNSKTSEDGQNDRQLPKVPRRRLAANVRLRAGQPEIDPDGAPPTDQRIIELGAENLTHLDRWKKAPMVWSIRGRIRKRFYYLIVRNREEKFWAEERVKPMVHDHNLEGFYKHMDSPQLFNTDGQRRRRSQKQIEDMFDPESGRFKKAKHLPAARTISEAAKDALAYGAYKNNTNDHEKPKRIQKQRAKLNEMAESTLKKQVDTAARAEELARSFEREHQEVFKSLRHLEKENARLKASNDFLEQQIEGYEADIATMDSLSYSSRPNIRVLPMVNLSPRIGKGHTTAMGGDHIRTSGKQKDSRGYSSA
ncbi:MAG: hypothetical protein L6R35_006789 [Caloplaca aegaea]|nr:MAG: hypothetical protein L6R35_006789 [Caloplaca aegaea]